MTHRRKKKKLSDFEVYEKTGKVPVAYQIFIRRKGRSWLRVMEQRKFLEDSKKDLFGMKLTHPEFKLLKVEAIIKQVPALPSELRERKILGVAGMKKQSSFRGFVESLMVEF